jgi:hypothetical protein
VTTRNRYGITQPSALRQLRARAYRWQCRYKRDCLANGACVREAMRAQARVEESRRRLQLARVALMEAERV